MTTGSSRTVRTVENIQARVPAVVWPVLVAVLCGAGALAVTIVDPHTPGRWPTCPSLTLTGFYCAGCGSMRAVNSLMHLDFMGALNMNPAIYVALPILGYLWLQWLLQTTTGGKRKLGSAKYIWALLAVIILYTILRNIPFFAPWLAPGA